MSGNVLTRFKSNLNKGWVDIKWFILITLEESSILHDGTFKLSCDSNLATALVVLDTHALESCHVLRANLEYSRGN
jgi:hypothetical protein